MKIRKAMEQDVSGIANVHINSWKTTYKGILPDQYLSSMNLEAKKKNWLRNLKMLHNATFVAENANGEIIGFAAGALNKRMIRIFKAKYMPFTFYKNINDRDSAEK